MTKRGAVVDGSRVLRAAVGGWFEDAQSHGSAWRLPTRTVQMDLDAVHRLC